MVRENEDVFVIERHYSSYEEAWICILADGQGGSHGGKLAAKIACEVTVGAALKLTINELLCPETWRGLLRITDEAVRVNEHAGFTTIVAAVIHDRFVVGASIGDSIAIASSKDSTFSLTGKQRSSPVIGSGVSIPVTFEHKLVGTWKVVFMSDGAWKYAAWNKMMEIIKLHHNDEIVEQVSRAAQLPNTGRFQDDCTVIAFEAREGDIFVDF